MNALAGGWNFDVPNINALMQPIQQGMRDMRQREQLSIENARADRSMAINEGQFKIAQQRAAREDDDAKIQRWGREANAIMGMQGPQKAQIWQRWLASNPEVASHAQSKGIDLSDFNRGPQFIATEAGLYDAGKKEREAADLRHKAAQSNLANAQAGYFRARGAAAMPSPAVASSPQPDPLAGAGLDENGNIVTPSGQSAEPQSLIPGGVPMIPRMEDNGRPVPSSDRFTPPMRLGGPMDDIERSMRLDEGRPQGVRVAQAGGSIPAVPGIRPELMDQAMSRFGTTGMTSPQVPGMVTDAGRNRRVDVPATREMQGQRAFQLATPEEQERLARFRLDQERWTGIYKSPPRAGYYYGPDGREMPKTDKNFKGDRENQAVALMNMNKIEQASKRLLDSNWVSRTVQGLGNIGEVGQAFADMKQGALGIAYALSGKTVAVAEMKNFIEAYGPVPGDSAERIVAKTQRMRDFYQALLTASRGGESYETAFARAMASTGLKNPDGSPAGAPAAASGGTRPQIQAPANDIRGLPTEELVRRLNGGR